MNRVSVSLLATIALFSFSFTYAADSSARQSAAEIKRATCFKRAAHIRELMTQLAEEDSGTIKKITHEDAPEVMYYTLHQDEIDGLDFQALRNEIFDRTGVTEQKIVQIVGDSSPLTEAGTTFGIQFLEPFLSGDWVVEYGFTGKSSDMKYVNGNPGEFDINHFVNDYIDNNPNQAQRFLGSVLGHTCVAIGGRKLPDQASKEEKKKALDGWKCYGSPLVKTFTLVYNDHGMEKGHTVFGNDVAITDPLCDEIVCLEGGMQSFMQVTNCLLQGRKVHLVTGLRRQGAKEFFSAAEFITRIYQEQAFTQQAMQALHDTYMANHKAWDETRHDASTKEALFNQVFKKFMGSEEKPGAWSHIAQLCTITVFDEETGEAEVVYAPEA